MDKKLQQLKKQYREKKQQISSESKASKSIGNVDNQQSVWEWYLKEEYAITGDPKKIRDHHYRKFRQQYIEARNAYWRGDIERPEYVSLVEDAMENEYERPLVEAGVTKNTSTAGFKKKNVYAPVFKIEQSSFPERGRMMKDYPQRNEVCVLSDRIGYGYRNKYIQEYGSN